MGVDDSTSVSPKSLPTDFEDSYLPKGKFVVAHVGSIGIANALETFFNCAGMMEEGLTFIFL